MSLIVTADIQAEFSNLDLCTQAWNEILSICKDKHLDTIVVAGDLKHSYNPVDIRVVKWWQHAISKAKKQARTVICVLGNHDRVGAYSSADNWFSILAKAGAIVYDKPSIHQLDKMRLFILPFNNPAAIKHEAKRLLKYKPDKTKDVLIFHADIKGTRYNQYGTQSESNLSNSSLCMDSYRWCIGGHVHLPQQVKENCYYVGSPFCMDWGEVNQIKRYLVIRTSGLQSVRSSIPRWYDPSVPGFQDVLPKTWKSARIRYSVSCDSTGDYGGRLEKARRRAEKNYPGARIFVVPKFEKDRDSVETSIRATDSDKRKIRKYVEQTCNRSPRFQRMAIKHMVGVLAESIVSLRQQSSIEFIAAKAKNFLSYEKLQIDFKDKGLVLIQGKNEDREGKSNGSGKTSLVQTIPVSMFGKTFKGQKADRWRNRWTEGNAYVEIVCRADGKRIKIRRERKPTALKMEINHKPVNSGMRTTDKDGTQGQIEQTLGYTWHTLANAVYIDRSIAEDFISGTSSTRTDLLSRFQNLERFETALKYVKKQYIQLEEKRHKVELLLSKTSSTYIQLKQSLKDVKAVQDSHIKGLYRGLKKAEKDKKKWYRTYKSVFLKLHSKEKEYEREYRRYQKKLLSLQENSAIARREFETVTETSGRWFKISKKKKCPTCLQPVHSKWVEQHSKDVQKEFDIKRKAWDVASTRTSDYKTKVITAESYFDEIQSKLSKLKREEEGFDINIQHLRKQYKQMTYSQGEAKWVIEKSKRKLIDLKDGKLVLENKLDSYRKKARLLRYIQEAFSRDGIPAFLNRQLCPVLNRASDYYAELFSDKELQVQFVVEQGEVIPKVVNSNGGADIGDQSEGEKALAGLIASFALRETTPNCNLLILDEPGSGLDEQTARQFARSLSTLVKRFGTIFVCTHNAHILSELNHERTITVRKKNKISHLEESDGRQ